MDWPLETICAYRMHGTDADLYGTEKKLPERTCQLRTHTCGWESNVKVNITNTIMYLCGLDYLAQDKEM